MSKSIEIKRRGYPTREEAVQALVAGGFVRADGSLTWYRVATEHVARICQAADESGFLLEFFAEPDAAVLLGGEVWPGYERTQAALDAEVV